MRRNRRRDAIRLCVVILARSRRLRWVATGVFVGALLILGLMVRQPTDNSTTTVEGYYTPNVQYGSWYLANHHRLFSVTGDIPTLSNYTSGLNYGAIDFTYSYTTGAALILSRVTDVERIGRLYTETPWQGLILVPLAILAIYSRFSRIFGREVSSICIVILYALATFSNYPMVDWALSGGTMVPLGWAIFFGVYLTLILRRQYSALSTRWSVLLIFYIALAQFTYHTLALALTVCLITIWLIQRYFGAQYLSGNTVRLSLVLFLTVLMYHAITFLYGYANVAKSIGDVYQGHDADKLKYALGVLDLGPWWYIVNYMALVLPILWLLSIFIRKNAQPDVFLSAIRYHFMWFIPLIPLAILFFGWGGVFGAYERVLQNGTLLALASAAILLAMRKSSTIPLLVAAVICIVVTTHSLDAFSVSTSNDLTKDELSSIRWISREGLCDKVIFTDFRIATTLGYWNCFASIGPSASTLASQHQLRILDQLFYSGNSHSLNLAISAMRTSDGRSPQLVILSKRFLDHHIGISLPDLRLKPLTSAQWSTYHHLPGWKVIFSNKAVYVLERSK